MTIIFGNFKQLDKLCEIVMLEHHNLTDPHLLTGFHKQHVEEVRK
jgi:hypothetical protein